MDSDQSVLANLGYKQEFRRDFSKIELFALSFNIVGVVQSIASILVYSIPYGGPVSMVWGWLAGSIFLTCIGLTIAELGSSAPTSGGLYFWTHRFASPRYRNYLSWLIGYVNTVGYTSGVAGVDYSCAVAILTAASISTDGTYVPTTGQIYGVFCALLLSHAFMASLPTKTLARAQIISIILNVGVFVAFIVAIPAATPRELKNDAKFVFGHFENVSGYSNGFAFFMSLLAPLWSVGGFDSSVHISEEAKNANTAVPFAIMATTTLGCLFGFATILALTFNMGNDLISIIQNPFDQPMALILLNSLGQKGFYAFWAFIVITLYLSGMDLLIATSRQIFAFSRDGALPLSRVLYRISPITGTPVHAVLMGVFIAALWGLFGFAGVEALSAVFTSAVVCQYLCYCTPVISRFVGGQKFNPGPFYLGKLSGPIATSATLFMLFMIVVLQFPVAPHPNAQTMSYTIVVVGGTIVLASVYYFVSGRHWFVGPVVTLPSSKVERDNMSDDSVRSNAGSKKEGDTTTTVLYRQWSS
ncbi:amino acid transporter [Dendrothele bispora CBS 962.96]|uniref:Amino acid transporter n=1 Tax=Dendrothele bispora (strain CBS 962.96) TaxID=1314807 RepID=A0A4S8MQ03_DENBC|nr:amino acid transporter [Dendrothele bispora CBS 962.96]